MGGVCSSQSSKKKKKIDKRKKKETELMLQILAEHSQGINCMVLNEDDTILASGSDDKTVRMWSAQTTPIECIGILKGHNDYITSVAMDSGFLVSGSADRTVRKWDTSTCECLSIMEGHSGTVNKVIITTEFIFSSSYDRTARCWDLDTCKCLRIFAGHSKSILPMVYLPSYLPTADDMQMYPSDASQFVQDDNRDLLFTGSADCSIKSFNANSGDTVKTYYGHTGAITCMTIDIETKVMISGSTDRTVRTWSIVHSSPMRVLEGHVGSIIALAVATKVIYSVSSDGSGRSWAMDVGECTRIMVGHKSGVTCMKYREGLVFTGSGDGFARCFSAKSGFLLLTFKDKWVHSKRKRPEFDLKTRADALQSMQISGNRLFTGSFDGLICVWDIEDIKDESEFVYGENDDENEEESSDEDRSEDDEYDDEYIENTRPVPVQHNGAAIPTPNAKPPTHLPPVNRPLGQPQVSTVNEMTNVQTPGLEKEFKEDDMDASDLMNPSMPQQSYVPPGVVPQGFQVPQNQAAAAASYYQQMAAMQQMQMGGAMPYNVGMRR